ASVDSGGLPPCRRNRQVDRDAAGAPPTIRYRKGNAMTLLRVALLAVLGVFCLAGEGRAQFTMPGQQGVMPGQQGMMPGQQQGMPPCMAEFTPLRIEAEKRGAAIKTAAQKKVPREQLCQLFRNFIEAETRVVKYLSERQAACGIPP